MSDEPSTIKVAVLEQKVLDLKEIVLRLEEAIERINDVNLNITKMLAVHEEKINTNEQNNGTLFAKVWEISQKIENEKTNTTTEFSTIKTDICNVKNELSSIKGKFLIGTAFVIFLGFAINNAHFFKNLLDLGNPNKSLLTNPASHARVIGPLMGQDGYY